ncbi:Putative Flp pilus-assembly TadE/G-like [Desulfotomaculum arcticum]|uniref:Putative Flp pilus-assembly TadE/G-like n=1 Tax=Desulfotruncus arcticus DSM 17038 TaxID=1121424 RepID=A0A1I2Z7J7_9FIRM|nr:pilus assembly protein TadG-related protein [Desulfotruncus arcticus]SFH33832.1 Putative Flp pilus-assembly TadE/G-like [Desulfotomaculum arcticum] [Desulfotruncus arcticus DSM 17038]
MKIFKDRRGSVSILTLFIIPVIIAVGAMVADIGNFFCVKISAKHMLNLAVRAAAGQIDIEELSNENIVIDESAASQKFYEALEKNLRLDSNLHPLTGSIIDGPVSVAYLKIINNDELPYTYSYGSFTETITQPSVTAIIEFPVKYGMLGQVTGTGTQCTMTVHVTAGPQLIRQEIGEF